VLPSISGLDPEQAWSLSHDLPYDIDISWSNADETGYYDIIFRRRSTKGARAVHKANYYSPADSKPLTAYANDPQHENCNSQLIVQLRRSLKERLPDYMVPSAFVFIDSLPLTSSGKIDRLALPAPLNGDRLGVDADYLEPQTEMEQTIAAIWQQVLRIERVGIRDNFFDLGGHSLLAIQIMNRINQTFLLDLPMRVIFEESTIASLALRIEESFIEKLEATANDDNKFELIDYRRQRPMLART
jgi:acyl carrier protein